ncbi:MAG: hypothetical protein CSA50_07065 [Gammaproteobacteria bacterium]|nr:MAG: hypothetical protein CSA50_07065 [Gammaproteobacteria bacterium]
MGEIVARIAGRQHPLVTAESPTQLNFPDLDTLAIVTQAIHQKKALQIQYRSLSSGLTTREIVPFALVDNGLRWRVRAHDRKRKAFNGFVVNRIVRPKILNAEIPTEQTRDADIQWNRIVRMHIVPHPRLSPFFYARYLGLGDNQLIYLLPTCLCYLAHPSLQTRLGGGQLTA